MTHDPQYRIVIFSDCPYFAGGAEVCLFDVIADPTLIPLLVVPDDGEIAEEARRRDIPVAVVKMGAVSGIRRPFRLRDGIAVIKDTVKAAIGLNAAARLHSAVCVHTNGLKAHGIACFGRLLGGPPVVPYMRSIPYTVVEKAFWWGLRLVSSRMLLVSRPCWHGRSLPANAVVVHDGIKPPGRTLEPRNFHRPLRIGFAGRLHPNKNVDLLIDWFDHARSKGFEATLTIRGEAQADQKDYAAILKDMVEARGLGEFVCFEGKVHSLERIYGDIDVNVVPSRTPDPFPRSVMESLAIGLPVIGYPAGGVPDMIEHGITGYLAHDAQSFLAALTQLTEDEDHYNAIRQNALEFVLENLTLEHLYSQLRSVWDGVDSGAKT
jgi:glycosyltransferase involved in cell wall biosynthesis